MVETIEKISILGQTLEYTWVKRSSEATVVLLHDSLGSVATWRDFPDVLSSAIGCSVLAYSRRGYGGSDQAQEPRNKDYLHHEGEVVLPALLNTLHVRRPILFGHSDGGSIAIIAAGAYPALAAGLILEAPHVFVEQITLDGIEKSTSLYETSFMRTRLGQYHDNPEQVYTDWRDTWLDPAFRTWNIEAYAERIQCPVLLIQGTNDEFGTIAQLEAIARQRPDRRIEMITDCAHTPHREKTDTVLAMAADFIASLPQNSAALATGTA